MLIILTASEIHGQTAHCRPELFEMLMIFRMLLLSCMNIYIMCFLLKSEINEIFICNETWVSLLHVFQPSVIPVMSNQMPRLTSDRFCSPKQLFIHIMTMAMIHTHKEHKIMTLEELSNQTSKKDWMSICVHYHLQWIGQESSFCVAGIV